MAREKQFGVKLKELRTGAGLSLRELADKVNVDYSYLSKIENNALPPPSQKVILLLAEKLNANKDELLMLAGKIPSDIAEILKDRKTIERLRAEHAKREARTPAGKEEAAHQSGDLKYLLGETSFRKKFARTALPVILAILAGILLWFAAPTTDTAKAANNKGVAYNNSGEFDRGISAFNKAIELDPNFAFAYNNRGWAYIELRQYEQGIADCTKAIELDPRLALAYSNRGLAYIRLGQYEQGIADCSKAIGLDPGLALAYSNRGTAYIELGQYAQAIADLDKAIELNPKLEKK
jgi:tetratricopeptide (TPR) repeat protein